MYCRKINSILNICLITLSGLIFACSGSFDEPLASDHVPDISPDYSNVTIPPNIAPMNFLINENGDSYKVIIHSLNGREIIIKSADNFIRIPADKWKKLLSASAGEDIYIDINIKKEKKWIKYKPIVNHVATDSVDRYLAYRLIYPGFEMWGQMGIYQRCLEDFKETPIMVNTLSENNCMNCHSFSANDTRYMLFHMRGKLAGTIFYRNDKISKINTKTDQTISAGVYPSWHPNSRFVAFSVNLITQVFHAVPDKKIEVIDTLSDLILYDAEANVVSQCEAIASKERYETFPAWSPDGHHLYFCSAKARPLNQYDKIKYDLLRIEFNPETQEFGKTDTIISSAKTGLSVSFPCVSPDGKYILITSFCMSQYGNFTIWHPDSDIYLLNISTNEIVKPDINSDRSESYHSWSSNGRWIVFTSRRLDGLFTRLWISYFDTSGKACKPFILPQKNPVYYDSFLKSYNKPEFIKTKVQINPHALSKYTRKEAVKASYKLDKNKNN